MAKANRSKAKGFSEQLLTLQAATTQLLPAQLQECREDLRRQGELHEKQAVEAENALRQAVARIASLAESEGVLQEDVRAKGAARQQQLDQLQKQLAVSREQLKQKDTQQTQLQQQLQQLVAAQRADARRSETALACGINRASRAFIASGS